MTGILAPPLTPRQIAPGRRIASTLVACPDARPPAYQAVVALASAGLLGAFETSTYYDPDAPWAEVGRRIAPSTFAKAERKLLRRSLPEVPADLVRSAPWVDALLAAENRAPAPIRRGLVRLRTEQFDRKLAAAVRRDKPSALLAFSDVATDHALPACRDLGIPTILSVVHGDPIEERAVLRDEAARSPDFLPIYLDSPPDPETLDWLHERRLMEAKLADLVLVPSEHIARRLSERGIDPARVRVVPYAADTGRFLPDFSARPEGTCTFLFAGAITQRKGIKYLLEAWRQVRRPGWRLQLLGGEPRELGPLAAYRDEVEWLGRVGHAEMPARLASADVFVFPSLFEGSAVVTYEALACGLPVVTTAESGSVVRDGREGFVVPSASVEALADRMRLLGENARMRAELATRARVRAEEFDWARYHRAVSAAVLDALALR